MTHKPTPHDLELYVAHTMATLPDSLRLRKIILDTALALLPLDFRGRDQVAKSIEAIHVHERTQLKFAALLNPEHK